MSTGQHRPYQLSALNERHRKIAQQLARDVQPDVIARNLSVSLDVVGLVATSQIGKAYIRSLREQASGQSIDVDQEMLKLAPEALRVLNDTLHGNLPATPENRMRLEAAREVLDRAQSDILPAKRTSALGRFILSARDSLRRSAATPPSFETPPHRYPKLPENLNLTLPNFLIIGAQRAGSTWLYQALRRHPDVYMPKVKEPEFFTYPERFERLGLDGYSKNHFGGVLDESAIGEASPSYLWASRTHSEWLDAPKGLANDIPARVRHALGPDVRLLVILRDPVWRALSAYLHHRRRGRLTDKKSVLEAGRFGGIVHMGFYYAHLQEWLKHFASSNFHVVIYEEARRAPEPAYEGVFDFLKIDAESSNPAVTNFINTTPGAVEIDGDIYLSDSSEDDPVGRPGERPIMTRDERLELRDIYKEDVGHLEDLLGRDLGSVWTNFH